jgi:hypothetical protein
MNKEVYPAHNYANKSCESGLRGFLKKYTRFQTKLLVVLLFLFIVSNFIPTPVGYPWRYLITKFIKMTPLHWAAQDGRTKDIEKLLDRGADINCRCVNQNTPLHYAAMYGRVNATKLLIEKGADLNAINSQNYTPLHMAVADGHVAIVKHLLSVGANTQIRDYRGKTPLDRAIEIQLLNQEDPALLRGRTKELNKRLKLCEQLLQQRIGGNNVAFSTLSKDGTTNDENFKVPYLSNFLFGLAGVTIFAGVLWLLIVAYRQDIYWFYFCLMLLPLSVIFVAKFWDKSKKPFFISLAGGLIYLAAFLLSLSL